MDHQAHADDLQPIAALNDLLFCERRCALHRIEQVWEDSADTLTGILGHQRADGPGDRTTADSRDTRGMWLRSERLRLIGKADVVEFRAQPERGDVPYPVEYKRGKRRRWDNDDVQLCAQALCLEEMLGVSVPASPELRIKTENAARQLHELVARGVTPPPVLKPRCRGCSLRELCLPQLLPETTRLREYQRNLYQEE